MNNLFVPIVLLAVMQTSVIFDFNKKANIQNWLIVDDVVMGGMSSGQFTLNAEGHGQFTGEVSLENNGGFSSVRYRFDKIDVQPTDKIVIRLKGDGKSYQFRVKDDMRTAYSYIISFNTSGDWEQIEIPLSSMYPSFRGRTLDKANFSHDHIEELAFLIGNKKAESFNLLIDKIELK